MNSLSALQEVGLLIGIPFAFLAFVTLLVFAGQWAREARYRPGTPWTADPTWLTGDDPDAQDEGGYGSGDGVIEPAAGDVHTPGRRAEPAEDTGGSGGSW